MKYVIGETIIEASDSWSGPNGYRFVYAKDHPNAPKSNQMYEHIVVMEKKLGRFLSNEEVVHHIDGDRSNNHPNNLMVYKDNAVHCFNHYRKIALDSCGNADYVKCWICKEWDTPSNNMISCRGYAHRICSNEYRNKWAKEKRRRLNGSSWN